VPDVFSQNSQSYSAYSGRLRKRQTQTVEPVPFDAPASAPTSKPLRLAVATMFKDKRRYLREWYVPRTRPLNQLTHVQRIEFHLITGVGHFYMYDNDSKDEPLGVLQPCKQCFAALSPELIVLFRRHR
jgi:hypothetical protein